MPFSIEQFFTVFERYNNAIFPFQFILLAASLFIALMAAGRVAYSNRATTMFLGLLWLWTGIGYHLLFFSKINPAAYIFASFCILQAIIFLILPARQRLEFRPKSDLAGFVGGTLIVFALVLYPLIGYLLGHRYPASPTFGAPCPTTIYTFGILLWTRDRLPIYVLIIPFLWSLIGFSAPFLLGVWEDTALVIAGLAGLLLSLRKPELNSAVT